MTWILYSLYFTQFQLICFIWTFVFIRKGFGWIFDFYCSVWGYLACLSDVWWLIGEWHFLFSVFYFNQHAMMLIESMTFRWVHSGGYCRHHGLFLRRCSLRGSLESVTCGALIHTRVTWWLQWPSSSLLSVKACSPSFSWSGKEASEEDERFKGAWVSVSGLFSMWSLKRCVEWHGYPSSA